MTTHRPRSVSHLSYKSTALSRKDIEAANLLEAVDKVMFKSCVCSAIVA